MVRHPLLKRTSTSATARIPKGTAIGARIGVGWRLVEAAPSDTFWGARFGMLTDKLGVHWMFNCELKKG